MDIKILFKKQKFLSAINQQERMRKVYSANRLLSIDFSENSTSTISV